MHEVQTGILRKTHNRVLAADSSFELVCYSI